MTGLPWRSLSVAMWTRQAVFPTPLGEARTAMLPVPQPAVDGVFEDAQGAALDQFGFDHRRISFVYRRLSRVFRAACSADERLGDARPGPGRT